MVPNDAQDPSSGTRQPMRNLFGEETEGGANPALRPLADRLRPVSLAEFVGQEHLTGPEGALRPLLDAGKLHSMIFWGDPGVGKTTLARLVSRSVDARFVQLSAVTSGVKDVRAVIERARHEGQQGRATVLFIDEIHRFNKGQQDALLHAVEEGLLHLIGATTENPSFEVIAPLLSRCRVYRFKPLARDDLELLLQRAIRNEEETGRTVAPFSEDARAALLDLARGDGRELLNLLERTLERAVHENAEHIELPLLESVAQQAVSRYDKAGEAHFDTISAFIKTVRNSDPDAAVYWLARMLAAGEDPRFIARRLIILASEDIGNANPNALLLAQAAFDAVHKIGMPEGRIILSQATTYLACSPKSNAAYIAINEAMELVAGGKQPPVPMHLRNAPTKLMKAEGYAEGYKYSHDYPGAVADMPGLPEELEGTRFYRPKEIGSEVQLKKRLEEVARQREQQREQGGSGEATS